MLADKQVLQHRVWQVCRSLTACDASKLLGSADELPAPVPLSTSLGAEPHTACNKPAHAHLRTAASEAWSGLCCFFLALPWRVAVVGIRCTTVSVSASFSGS